MVGKEGMATLVAFHDSEQWCKSLSATFIILIPKKSGASEIKDSQPISLVGCLQVTFKDSCLASQVDPPKDHITLSKCFRARQTDYRLFFIG